MFESGESFALTAELLRVESPSAEVQGHGAGQKTTPSGKQNVAISRVEPVGNYAVRLVFDDGHDSGLFSWDILHDYGMRQDSLMAENRDFPASLSRIEKPIPAARRTTGEAAANSVFS